MINMRRENWLEVILDTLPDHVFILDRNGRYIESFGGTYCSSAFSAKSYTDLHLRDVFSSTKASELVSHIHEVLESNETKVVKYSLALQDHLLLPIEELALLENPEETWFEAIIKPVKEYNGDTGLVIWSVRDITRTHLLEQRLKLLSETDELTGVLNRRAFLSHFETLIIADKEHSKTLSCLMIDIDHFKQINDQVGHFSGDHVIRHVAQVCLDCIGDKSVIGRLGGEEFAVILEGKSAIQAYNVAERIRHSVQQNRCDLDGIEISTTVSIGVAELCPSNLHVKELLINADKAMYYSKHSGRNQVTVFRESLPELKLYQTGHLNIQKVS